MACCSADPFGKMARLLGAKSHYLQKTCGCETCSGKTKRRDQRSRTGSSERRRDAYQKRSEQEREEQVSLWMTMIHARALENLDGESGVREALNKVAKYTPSMTDPVNDNGAPGLGCILWYGDMQNGQAITTARGSPVFVNRLLVFCFANDESFDALRKGVPEGPAKDPFQMGCSNQRCICLQHIYVPGDDETSSDEHG